MKFHLGSRLSCMSSSLQCCTALYSSSRSLSIGRLASKSFIRVIGKDTPKFLQGLLTNDMRSIDHLGSFMYSFLLNTKGRILADLFVYHLKQQSDEDAKYVLEVDSNLLEQLLKYLNRYNIRRKVSIQHDPSVSVYVAMPSTMDGQNLTDPKAWLRSGGQNSHRQCPHLPGLLFYASDPRGTPGWSGRIVVRSEMHAQEAFLNVDSTPLDLGEYERARWTLGLPEGSGELISEESLPLEANGDLSGAINFSKGCYTGQELTARTRFTGVVRRRLVPVLLRPTTLDNPLSKQHMCGLNAPIFIGSPEPVVDDISSKSRPVGWLRAVQTNAAFSGLLGLALLRLSEAAANQNNLFVILPDIGPPKFQLFPYCPAWWSADIVRGLERMTSA